MGITVSSWFCVNETTEKMDTLLWQMVCICGQIKVCTLVQ